MSVKGNVIAKYISHGKSFEIIVDAEKVWKFKSRDLKDISDALLVDGVFSNLRKVKSLDKGALFKDNKTIQRIEESELEDVFGTSDIEEISRKIIEDGEIQYTTEQRREILERKRTRVINLIAGQSIDPRTNSPHTASRIESAMEQAKVNVDMYKPAESQVQNIVKSLIGIIPIKLEFKEVQIKSPIRYASHIKRMISDFGQIKKEDWCGQDYIVIMTIGAGMLDTFLGKINGTTHGEAITRIL